VADHSSSSNQAWTSVGTWEASPGIVALATLVESVQLTVAARRFVFLPIWHCTCRTCCSGMYSAELRWWTSEQDRDQRWKIFVDRAGPRLCAQVAEVCPGSRGTTLDPELINTEEFSRLFEHLAGPIRSFSGQFWNFETPFRGFAEFSRDPDVLVGDFDGPRAFLRLRKAELRREQAPEPSGPS